MSTRGARGAGLFGAFRSSDGAQLLEFAMVLPIMLLLAVGIIDFGAVFTLKQKLNNGAREGARFALQEACSDCTGPGSGGWGGTPQTSTKSILNDLLNYLTNTGINVCGMTSSSTGSNPNYADYIFTSSCTDTGGTLTIEINRAYSFVDANGNTVTNAVEVTISRPYKWSPFTGHILGSSLSNISTNAIMY